MDSMIRKCLITFCQKEIAHVKGSSLSFLFFHISSLKIQLFRCEDSNCVSFPWKSFYRKNDERFHTKARAIPVIQSRFSFQFRTIESKCCQENKLWLVWMCVWKRAFSHHKVINPSQKELTNNYCPNDRFFTNVETCFNHSWILGTLPK